ncbi:hypothetical protein BH23PLA1_BH23PLA1_43870 [soil metagenome]
MSRPVRFLLDENLRGPLWEAILRHNTRPNAEILDAVRVGDPPAPPLGTADPEILRWAEREARILVINDRQTMAAHLRDHLALGGRSPGVFLVPNVFSIAEVVEFLVLAAYVADPSEWYDRIAYL